MSETPSDNSITSRLAEAEMAHNTASAMLAASLVREREAQNLCATLQKETPIWVAAATTRQSLDRWELPRILPVAVFPFPVTVLGFIAAAELTGVVGVAAVIAITLFLAACGVMVLICLFPDDQTVARLRDRLPVAQQHLAASQQHREQMQGQVNLASERLADAREAVSKAEHEIIRVRQEKEQRFEAWLKTIEDKCQTLLRHRWRDMRGDDFEQFLAEVLRTVGYEVHVVGQSGDQGVDLIAVKDGKRVAVQAKGYAGSVGNFAVQEVYAGMTHYSCHACAVITNSTFTPSALSLAASTQCLLVHEDNFTEFVYGRVDLTGEYHSVRSADA
jgi:HJR/Mrr/RecB family endonuclease